MPDNNAAIHICNSALYRLGENPITSLEEGTDAANACKELYPDVRDIMLSWQAWPFATVRQSLAKLAAVPASDFASYYALPTLPYPLRLIDIDLESFRIPYQREVYVNPLDPNDQQNVIATDATAVVMRYVGRTTEGIWIPLFAATVAVYLAQALTASITGKASLKQGLLLELYGNGKEPGLMAKLRDIAGYEDSPREIPMPDTYLTVRDTTGGSAPTTMW